MVRFASVIAVLALLFAAGPLPARAQTASSTPSSASADLGAPVVAVGPDGAPLVTVTLTQLTDPFDQFDPSSPPARGFHFVFATVTIANSGPRPLKVRANQIVLLDGDGFEYSQTTIHLGDKPTLTLFQDQDALAPGLKVSGAIGFLVLNGAAIAKIVYAPASDRLVTLLDRSPAPAAGAAVPFVGPDGTTIGTMAVADVQNPFEAYDPGSPPSHGDHFLIATVTITNTGPRPLKPSADRIAMLDADGYLTSSSRVHRVASTPPDLQNGDDLAPGASTSGVVGFEVLNAAAPVALLYSPDSGQIVTVAAFGPASTGSPARGAATPQANAPVSGCDGSVTWRRATLNRFGQANAIKTGLGDLATASEAIVRKAGTDMGALGDQQRSGRIPPSAADLNELYAGYFTGQSAALAYLADAIKAGDAAQAAVAIANVTEGDAPFAAGGQAEQLALALVKTCPDLNADG